MTDKDKKVEAKRFAETWATRGDEKQETQIFWLELLQEVFGIAEPTKIIQFEKRAKLDSTGFIDAYLPATSVLIEQKSSDIDLRKTQSSGLTPYQQARQYASALPFSERPRYIVTCNFREFLIYDQEKPTAEPESVLLKDLPKEYYRLAFLVDEKCEILRREEEVSVKAGEIVGRLYDALLKQYENPEDKATLHSLNVLCVRLVFCLYAEDAGIFGVRNQFADYLRSFQAKDVRQAILNLFRILDTPVANRDRYEDPALLAFPYVNGGLFSHNPENPVNPCDENMVTRITGIKGIEIPQFTQEIVDILLHRASEDFDWSQISPTIFGAVFESTLNPETRRKGGMHYTSIENIHKVIDPLFLDDLKAEFEKIRSLSVATTKNKRLREFQLKLGRLKFLDPACGSGNFLTETYISLRRLENDALREMEHGQALLDLADANPIEVKISQFSGIEINDFAVTVAKTALWIAENQMMKETESIIDISLDFLPLKTNATIVEGNALRIDWKSILVGSGECGVGSEWGVRCEECGVKSSSHSPLSTPHSSLTYNYIIGNPPFVGYSLQSPEQKADILSLYIDEKGKPYKTAGKIDYVAGWYWKAAQLMQGTTTRAALVSTNSITQGEQVAAVWKPLMERFGLTIDFAHRTFRWDSEASAKAHVHCVIIGFSMGGAASCRAGAEQRMAHIPRSEAKSRSNALAGVQDAASPKIIFNDNKPHVAQNINAYLLDANNVFVESRSKPLCDVPEMTTGNRPADGGHLIIEAEDYAEFIKKEPDAVKYVKRLMGSAEFINNRERYCLWLVGANPADLRRMPLVIQRIEACKQDRLNAPDEGRRKLAITPTLFREQLNPSRFIIVPAVSSERRAYVPLGFLDENTIPTNLVQIIPNATLYHFGVLTSSVHMAWMRAVCGRLKSDYRYSKDIVYNNFPWPEVSGECGVGSGEFLRKGKNNDTELQGFNCMAEGYRSSTGDLSLSEITSKRRDICDVGSDEASRDIDSIEHCRRTSAFINQGVSSVFGDSERLEGRIGNTIDSMSKNRIHESTTDRESDESISRNQKDVECVEEKTSLNPHSSLPTPHSSLITRTAQAILDTRARYPDASLADLYDELTMPPDLRKAHQANDRAVLEAYGLPHNIDEPAIVAHLMKLYQELT